MINKKMIIENSHKRCENYGVTRDLILSKKIISGEKLTEVLKKNNELIKVARPYINMIHDSMEKKEFITILTDSEGCILYLKGDKDSCESFEGLNLKIGAYMNEKSIGTNAMGTALEEDMSVQITANEHYIKIFEGLTCSAAPIHHLQGNIIGTLNLTGKSNMAHTHSLALAVFGVKTIEKELDRLMLSNVKDNIRAEGTGAFYTFKDIIGSSDPIKNVITNCKFIANSPSTVLIEGESGTGKEVLAQAIHNASNRREYKFIAINCAAIPSNLIESELFGYEDGTFTGGKKGGKIGKFERANGGTVFLDEIGEMPIEMQVHLLRVLQEGRFTRIGGEREIPIDVRVIAATNKKLKKEVSEGRFREDLYYRLCVIPVKIPALRERKGDVKKLIDYFIRVKSSKLNKSIIKIENSLYSDLINYSWPGNIRQLENTIENIVNLNGELSFDLWDDEEVKNKEKYKNNVYEDFNLEHMEKKIITEALSKFDNNITKVAKELGISRNTLYLKINKYNIQV